MRNLVEIRIRVSKEIFELMRNKLRGIIEEFDSIALDVLPSKDVEIKVQIPEDEKNRETLEDTLDAYRLIMRYMKKFENIEARGVPTYDLQYTRGSFE